MNKNRSFNFSKTLIIFALVFNFGFLGAKPEGGSIPESQRRPNPIHNDLRSADEPDLKYIQHVYAKLFASQQRPTMEEVLNAFGGDIPDNTNHIMRMGDGGTFSKTIAVALPAAIAQLELAYPGAIWAGLGRDAATVADLLEAFYLGMGQAGRAVRINVSRGTFSSDDSKDYAHMLRDAGMDIENAMMRPFIIIDRTSYQSHSQSVQLIRHIYSYFVNKTKLPASDLIEQVAVVSSHSGHPVTSREVLFKNLKQTVYKFGYPHQLISVGELANFTDRAAWHNPFGPLTVYPDGKKGGSLGAPMDEGQKKLVLNMMIEGYKRVTTPQFQNAVRAAAKNLGYDFDRHMKKYANKDWKSPLVVPNEPDEEELIDEALDIYFATPLLLHPELEFLITYLKKKYKREILQVIEHQQMINGKQTIEAKRAIITAGFENMQSALVAESSGLIGHFERIMFAFLKTFSKYQAYENYFSDNATEINNMFNDILVPTSVKDMSQYTLSYLRLLEKAKHDEVISSKDYRRLILFALGQMDNNPNFFAGLSTLFRDSPELQDNLIKHAKVYLTSSRNKNAAQRVYLDMIQRGFLPKPSECDMWLRGEREDNGDQSKVPKRKPSAIRNSGAVG